MASNELVFCVMPHWCLGFRYRSLGSVALLSARSKRLWDFGSRRVPASRLVTLSKVLTSSLAFLVYQTTTPNSIPASCCDRQKKTVSTVWCDLPGGVFCPD